MGLSYLIWFLFVQIFILEANNCNYINLELIEHYIFCSDEINSGITAGLDATRSGAEGFGPGGFGPGGFRPGWGYIIPHDGFPPHQYWRYYLMRELEHIHATWLPLGWENSQSVYCNWEWVARMRNDLSINHLENVSLKRNTSLAETFPSNSLIRYREEYPQAFRAAYGQTKIADLINHLKDNLNN